MDKVQQIGKNSTHRAATYRATAHRAVGMGGVHVVTVERDDGEAVKHMFGAHTRQAGW